MGYCSISDIRNLSVDFNNSSEYSDSQITLAIDNSTQYVNSGLSARYSIEALILLSQIPQVVIQLAKYKSAELLLIALHAQSRHTEINDIQYWKMQFEDTMKAVIDGKILLFSMTGIILLNPRNIFDSNVLTDNLVQRFGYGDAGDIGVRGDLGNLNV